MEDVHAQRCASHADETQLQAFSSWIIQLVIVRSILRASQAASKDRGQEKWTPLSSEACVGLF
jgi:hypothetical protein